MRNLRILSGMAVMAAAMTAGPAAQGGYGSVGGGYGSSGGIGAGAYGSVGGSSGGYGVAAVGYGSSGVYGSAGYGSSGGDVGGSHGGGQRHVGPLRRLLHHHREHKAARAAHGSSGGGMASYGSSGGGFASYGGGGASYGSSGGVVHHKAYAVGHGSSGGSSGGFSAVPTHYYQDSVPYEMAPQQAPPAPEADAAVDLGDDSVLMTVAVPDSALVQVNGLPTSSTGPIRQFMSKGLKPGFLYKYEVEVLYEGAQQPERRTVKMRAGTTERLVFAGPSAPAVASSAQSDLETVVTLRVPADAKVVLAGNETQGEGEVRTFRSRRLAEGQRWEGYTVRVTAMVNGSMVTKEQTLDLVAGSAHEVSFEFDATEVASR